MTTRRTFLLKLLPSVGVTMMLGHQVFAAGSRLEESEGVAQALGYVQDTKRANQAKYPKHMNSQSCRGCQLYNGGDQVGSCRAFPEKEVNANGWCSSFISKV